MSTKTKDFLSKEDIKDLKHQVELYSQKWGIEENEKFETLFKAVRAQRVQSLKKILKGAEEAFHSRMDLDQYHRGFADLINELNNKSAKLFNEYCDSIKKDKKATTFLSERYWDDLFVIFVDIIYMWYCECSLSPEIKKARKKIVVSLLEDTEKLENHINQYAHQMFELAGEIKDPFFHTFLIAHKVQFDRLDRVFSTTRRMVARIFDLRYDKGVWQEKFDDCFKMISEAVTWAKKNLERTIEKTKDDMIARKEGTLIKNIWDPFIDKLENELWPLLTEPRDRSA